MYLGGLDIGTTGCKLTVYNEKGKFIINSYREYNVNRDGGEHELDGNSVWACVKAVIHEVTDEIGSIDALGVTSFGESFVLLDENDNVLMPSMLYTDPRGAEEAKKFSEEIMYKVGVKPHSMFSLPKLMWIKNNRSEVFCKAKRVLLYQDFIVYMLSGVAQIDYSLATRTMAFDIKNKCWDMDIFKTAGIDRSLMSKPVKSGTVAGKVSDNELGLTDTLIVTGCHDQIAALTGAGVFENMAAVDGSGTVECIVPVFDEIPHSPQLYAGRYAIVPHIFDEKYTCYAFSFTGGALLKWYRDKLGNNENYSELDKTVGSEPSGLLILPHFAGAANPYMDSGSKGAIVGLTLETEKKDIYRGLMEAVAYEMLINIEMLSSCGIDIDTLYVTGGGANSDKWVQLKADILNRNIVAMDAPEVGAAGTVMLVGTAIGAFTDMENAKELIVHEKKRYVPDSKMHEKYMKYYEKYKSLYKNIRPLI